MFAGLLSSSRPSSGEQTAHFSGRADALISALISKNDSDDAQRPLVLPADPWLATRGVTANKSVSWWSRQAVITSDEPRAPGAPERQTLSS